LGATRCFTLRHRGGKNHLPLDLSRNDGSLLAMRGSTQRFYRHGVPRERTVQTPRINLTFRFIEASLARPRLLGEADPQRPPRGPSL
jgi:hypothetical protein